VSGYVGYVKECGTNLTVAKVFAATRSRVVSEIMHYAWLYSEEGPVTIVVRKCPRKKHHVVRKHQLRKRKR
jgi:hypothetical protein